MTDTLQRAMVTLSIDEDDLDPDEMTALLGGKPRLSARRGEIFTGQNGRQITARTGKWLFGSGYENPPNIGKQIATLLAQLTQDLTVWKSVTTRFHCYVGVGGYFDGWTGGISLEPDVLMLLAERGLTIDFDLYALAASDQKELP